MGEHRRTHHDEDEAKLPHPTPGPRPANDLAQAVYVLDQELDRHARLYEDAHTVRNSLGGTIKQVLDEVAGLETRRAALAMEIGELETRLVELRAEVTKAEAGA